MKIKNILTGAILAMLAACTPVFEEPTQLPASLGISNTELSFSPFQESKYLTLTTKSVWQILDKPDWVTISADSEPVSAGRYIYSTGTLQLNIRSDSYSQAYNSNNDRSGRIVIYANDMNYVINVKQESPYFYIYENNARVTSGASYSMKWYESNLRDFTIRTNINTVVEMSGENTEGYANWFSGPRRGVYKPTEINGEFSFGISKQNLSEAERQISFRIYPESFRSQSYYEFSYSQENLHFVVICNGIKMYDGSTVNIPSIATTSSLSVASNIGWSAQYDEALSFDRTPTQGQSTNVQTSSYNFDIAHPFCTVGYNNSFSPKTYDIRFIANYEGHSAQMAITIRQEGYRLTLSSDNVKLVGVNRQNINITSDGKWNLERPVWLTVNNDSGGKVSLGTLELYAQEYNLSTLQDKTGIIVVRCPDNGLARSVTVTQERFKFALAPSVTELKWNEKATKKDLDIDCTAGWTIEVKYPNANMKDWLKLSSTTGSGSGKVTFESTVENSSKEDYEAEITLVSTELKKANVQPNEITTKIVQKKK